MVWWQCAGVWWQCVRVVAVCWGGGSVLGVGGGVVCVWGSGGGGMGCGGGVWLWCECDGRVPGRWGRVCVCGLGTVVAGCRGGVWWVRRGAMAKVLKGIHAGSERRHGPDCSGPTPVLSQTQALVRRGATRQLVGGTRGE